jgi:hypothetical protein
MAGAAVATLKTPKTPEVQSKDNANNLEAISLAVDILEDENLEVRGCLFFAFIAIAIHRLIVHKRHD